MKMRTIAWISGLVLLLGLTVSACGDDGYGGSSSSSSATVPASAGATTPSAGGSSQVCNDLADLRSSLNTVASSTDASSLRANVNNVESAVQDLRQDASAQGGVDTSNVESAYDDLTSTVDDLPDDASLRDRLSAISQPLAGLVEATQQLRSEVKC